MSNILILGAGSMGTAFSFPCSDNKHSVTIVGTHFENDFIDLINKKKFHTALQVNVPDNVKFIKFENFQEEINKNIDLIVVAVVSKGIEWASNQLCKSVVKKIPILLLTKGLAIYENEFEILAKKMERIFKKNGIKETNILAAGGPCLAKGLANRVHTSVIFANTNIEVADKVSKMVSTNYYHISTTNDVAGVEICAGIKNIYSMAIGAAQGLCNPNASNEIQQKNYLNTAAALIQQSIYEMITFTQMLKANKETALGLAGIGDLYVSADGGRNSKMGFFLGQGMNLEQIKKTKMVNDTIEGVDILLEIGEKVKKDFDNKKIPLMISMINLICHNKPLFINWDNFN